MRSPVSRSPLRECNAIKSWGFGERDLTFDLNVKTAFQRFPQTRFWTRQPDVIGRLSRFQKYIAGLTLEQ
jgi:hypothetical protein